MLFLFLAPNSIGFLGFERVEESMVGNFETDKNWTDSKFFFFVFSVLILPLLDVIGFLFFFLLIKFLLSLAAWGRHR